MEEKEKEYQPILPAHPENEQPEEGFVPYCGSEEAENEQRDPKKKLLLLLIMIALLVLIIAVSMVLRKSNYYHTVLRNLRFDYRGGEFVFADSLDDPGERSYALADEIVPSN